MWEDILKRQFTSTMRPSQIDKPEEMEIELDRDALAESCCQQAKLDVHNAWIKAFEDANQKPEEWQREGIYNKTIENTCYGLKDVIRRLLASHRTERDFKKNIQKILDEWEECESGD
tara:strand:+ start:84 stop:434 length:351 start_codon:yes stop_codon:yes gene_type:complete